MAWSAAWLREARKARGLSQGELGAKVGASQGQVSQWETGKLEPSRETVAVLEKILGRNASGLARSTASDAEASPSLTTRGGPRPAKAEKANGGDLGFEKKLWLAADKLRSNMDAAEYKHVVLGLIFLKYISDAFEERHHQLESERADGADPEDRDEYRGASIFWVPKETRWAHLAAQAKQPTIGKLIDDAMVAIERDNPSLKGVLPKEYARPALDKQRLGELLDLIGTITLGDEAGRSKDILGRVYEYFLSEFALAEGRKGGQFYTPKSVVRFVLYSYLSRDFQDLLRSRTVHGSTVDRIPLIEMPSFPIRVPSLAEQRAIAAVLGALDDKIDLNRRMNETFEAIARALFKSWFIDFDPVRAKAEGRKPAGMDAETAALFPSEFEGGLPKGWHSEALDSAAEFLNGLALQNFRPHDADTSLPVIKIAQLRSGSPGGSERASSSIDPRFIVANGDILFSWSGSLEVVVWSGGRGALNQHLFKVTSANYPKWFILGWLLYHLPAFREIAADKATTMGHIQRHHLTQAEVVVPSSGVLATASAILGPLFNRRLTNAVEAGALSTLRDVLLPKLMSGELRVREAERLMGAVT